MDTLELMEKMASGDGGVFAVNIAQDICNAVMDKLAALSEGMEKDAVDSSKWLNALKSKFGEGTAMFNKLKNRVANATTVGAAKTIPAAAAKTTSSATTAAAKTTGAATAAKPATQQATQQATKAIEGSDAAQRAIRNANATNVRTPAVSQKTSPQPVQSTIDKILGRKQTGSVATQLPFGSNGYIRQVSR